jgi:hypothetical protein
MAYDVLLTPRWFRRLDLGLAALQVVGVVILALRLLSPLVTGGQVTHSALDAALLLGPVVCGALLRSLVLWPSAARRLELDGRSAPVAWWPAPVVRQGALELCPASWDSLPVLGLDSWWARYRVLVLQHGLRGAARRALLAALTVASLTGPVFFLQQAVGYGGWRGQWVAEGFGPWARALARVGLAVGVSAAVWWALLAVAVHLAWAALCTRPHRPGAGAAAVLWAARVAWVALPLTLYLRQLG